MLQSPNGSPYKGLYSLYSSLSEIASHCLHNPSQPREFHLALTLSCLGALKFANLDDQSRYFLYLTASYLGEML
jgi:hypothetical protein